MPVHPPLIARIQNGSETALRELIRLYQDAGFALALAQLHDPESALAAALRAARRIPLEIHEVRDTKRVPQWLGRMQRRACAGNYESGCEVPELGALSKLRLAEEREVSLQILCGRSEQQAAEYLGLPQATVHTRWHISNRRLKHRALAELEAFIPTLLPSRDEAFLDLATQADQG